MRRFELVRGLTRRFWHVSVEGMHVTVTTGIAGTPAQPLTATFPSPQAALAEQESIRSGDERNYARVLERLKPYQDEVGRHQKNVDALRAELNQLR